MKRLGLNDERYGRLVLVGLSLLIWLLIIISFKVYGYNETWQLWKVPTATLPFSDFRLIPGSAESFLKGFEPTIENPFDPFERTFNYPTFWRFFFYSGVTQADTVWISVSMIILFFIGVFIFPNRLSNRDALMMLPVLFSPAAMLLYERGNVDLIVFFVCALTLVLESYSPYLAVGGIVLASVMKMYPFFGVSILLRESKSKFIKLFAASSLVFIAYFYLTFDSAKASWTRTMRGDEISYGANVFFDGHDTAISAFLSRWSVDGGSLLKFGPIALAFLLILLTSVAGLKRQQALITSSERNLTAFRMGASIYLGTFLLGNNWDYRLAFLIVVVPQILEWARQNNKNYRYVAVFVLVAVLASCWHFVFWFGTSFTAIRTTLFNMDEFFNWSLVAGFSYLFFASLPEWMRSPFLRRTELTMDQHEPRNSPIS